MRSGQGQMSTPSRRRRLTKDCAAAYLKKVKDSFQDNEETYDHFIQILKDYQAQRVDTAGVMLRVKELFEGHRHLILGFNTFLPEGYEITLPMEDEPLQRVKEVDFLRATSFIDKVKTRFKDRENVYSDFLHLLQSFRNGNVTILEVMIEVLGLFHGHNDLLGEFMEFLPDKNGR